MNLFQASAQWKNRPADERFWNFAEMREACFAYVPTSRSATVDYNKLRVIADPANEDLRLHGETTSASISHYAMTQLARTAKVPVEYLRTLPAELAATNMNYKLSVCDAPNAARLLLHKTDDGDMVVRCATSSKYERIWNYEIVDRLSLLAGNDWRTPPARPANNDPRARPATEEDCLQRKKLGGGLAINVGDMIAPAGLYASDKDMFVFMVDDDHVVNNPLSPDAPLAKGFFMWNSEVGDKSFGMTTFLYDAVCGNHIVWGAQEVKDLRIRHVGHLAKMKGFRGMQIELKNYTDAGVDQYETKIRRAQTFQIAATKEDTLDQLFKYIAKRHIDLSKSEVTGAYEIAENSDRYGSPRTPWAIVQGLTEQSQRASNADARVKVDREAGKLLEIAF